jgi:DNA-binding Lrp family transcriptional regulator
MRKHENSLLASRFHNELAFTFLARPDVCKTIDKLIKAVSEFSPSFSIIMDSLDIALLRELTQGGRILPGRPGPPPSYREIARSLGISPATAHNRVSAMYEQGVLTGSSVFPNPNLLGLRAGACTMEISPSKNKYEAIAKLKLVDGVGFIHNFLGTGAWTVFVYENEKDLKDKLGRFEEISGSKGTFSNIPYPPCARYSFSQFDSKLILEVSKKGLGKYADIAKDLGVSSRTLIRRLSRLVMERAILSLPKVDYRAMTGCVPADLLVFFESNEVRAKAEPEIVQIVKEYLVLAGLFDIVGMCSLIIPKVSIANVLAEKVRQIEGVNRAWVGVVEEHIDQVEVFGNYVERMLATQGARDAGEIVA